MKLKHYIHLASLILIGQIIYFIWPEGNLSFIALRSLVIAFSVKILGDLLGRFVFHIPGYNWLYLRDYLANELLSNVGMISIVVTVWLIPTLYMGFWGYGKSLVAIIWDGGLVPSLLYMIIDRNRNIKNSDSNRRLKPKI